MRRRILFTILFMSILTLVIKSCRKENVYSRLIVKLTDAPGFFQEVNIDIRGIDVYFTGNNKHKGRWHSLPSGSRIYNLIELQNGTTIILADDNKLPAGHISQLRLILGDANSVVTNNIKYDLHVYEGNATSISVPLNEDLIVNQETEIILDFDADKSIVKNQNGNYFLKPEINVLIGTTSVK